MRHFKKIVSEEGRLCRFLLIILLFSTSNAVAQEKVVVIPLFENQQANASLSPVPRTGQTISYSAGDDGDLEKGIDRPVPRFTDNGDGTVTDNLTDLIWLKNANCFGQRDWATALTDCNTLASGSCGLTDGSVAGDWRLPNIKELPSLIDFGRHNPALPTGHPFTGLQSSFYWSSTTDASSTVNAWTIYLYYGYVIGGNKTTILYVWPVRGGN